MSRIRGIAWRLPYCPCDRRPADSPASRSSVVSWSETTDGAPAQLLPLRQAAGGFSGIAQLSGFVVRIERQRNSATRPARPPGRPQGAARPHALDDPAPPLLGPLPGRQFGIFVFHAVPLSLARSFDLAREL